MYITADALVRSKLNSFCMRGLRRLFLAWLVSEVDININCNGRERPSEWSWDYYTGPVDERK